MSKPNELWWVEYRRGPANTQNYKYSRYSAKGGKVSSHQAALDRQRNILRFDPQAEVKIYSTKCRWYRCE